ncbi:MAG: flavin reductase [Oscillospiraceae bacterium]|jgi:flavin reductase (DIM6/NTAB) family NADH-FMN oxidoreductase RutF|nr:flavin reductase [Oscillospiraceae bacterium]
MAFIEIKPEAIPGNVFDMVGREWMLITAGTPDSFNTMTASWGALGVLWGRNTAMCFVRPQRYTHEFMEQNEYYTLSFYAEEYRPQLVVCGGTSGRDVDKVELTNFKAQPTPEGAVYFREAKLVIVCRKLYDEPFKPENFRVPDIDGAIYPTHDYHRMYVGEIVRVLIDIE